MTPRIGIYRNIFSFFCLKFQKGKLFGNHNISHFRKNPHLEQKSLFPREVPTVLPTVVGRSSKAAGLLTATCVALTFGNILHTTLSFNPGIWFLIVSQALAVGLILVVGRWCQEKYLPIKSGR